jgi:hypothetical protein
MLALGEPTPERQALLCCARVQLDEASRRQLHALLAGPIDLRALAGLARRHGLGALVARHVPADATDGGAGDALAELRAEARQRALASLALAAELVAVLAALRAAGVTALAIKGPVSAALAYGDLGLRAFADLDLLVAPADVAAAAACLEARGYLPRFALPPAWRARLVRSDSELLFEGPGGGRPVDLHWSLLPRGYSFTPAADGVFARRRTVRIGPDHVPTLAVEPTLLFLLLHGIKHDWRSLAWLCDVAELVRRHPGLDWDAVAAWSSESGRRRLIDVGLALAHGLLGAPVPEPVLARGRAERAVARIAAVLARRLFSAGAGPPRTIFSYPYLMAMSRPADRLRFLHDVALRPTPHEWRAFPVPIALAPVHYLVRPLRLLWKHGRPRRPV